MVGGLESWTTPGGRAAARKASLSPFVPVPSLDDFGLFFFPHLTNIFIDWALDADGWQQTKNDGDSEKLTRM